MPVSLKRWLRTAGIAVALALNTYCALPAYADSENKALDWVSASDFGGVGLMQTRTARFGTDGVLDIGTSFVDPYKRYYVNLLALPWLEGTFRYTEIRNRLFSQFRFFSGGQSFKDRGADLKFRLRKEGRYWPALAVVFQDGLGTGQFSGEALVANKRYYDLDFSFGLGWRYLGKNGKIRNPMISLSEDFRHSSGSAHTGGQFNFGSFFSGETVAPFAGVAYRSPIRGLTFKMEIESNDYQSEPLSNRFPQNSPFNFGLNYRPFSWFDISLAYERGNILMFRGSLRANLHTSKIPKFDPPPEPIGPRPKRKGFGATQPTPGPESENSAPAAAMSAAGGSGTEVALTPSQPQTSEDIAADLLGGLEAEGLQLESIGFSEDETTIGVTGQLQAMSEAAVVRAAGVVTSTISPVGKKISFVQASTDGEVIQRGVSRDEAELRHGVDQFFEQVEKQGVEILWVGIDNDKVELGIRPTDAAGDLDEVELAKLILLSLPVSARDLTVVTYAEGVAPTETDGLDSEVTDIASGDGAFDNLGYLDLEIEPADSIDNRRIVSFRRKVARAGPPNCPEVSCASSGAEIQTHEDIVYDDEEKRKVADRVIRNFRRRGMIVHAFHLSGRQATVFVTVGRFMSEAQRLGRAARVLANSVPEPVEKLTLVVRNGPTESYRVTLNRRDLEMAANFQGSVEEVWRRALIEKPRTTGIPDDAIRNSTVYPRTLWTFGPRTRQHIGGPDQFMLYQFWAALNVNIALAPGLGVSAGVGKNLYHNFDKIKLKSDSSLPHVRSDIKDYLQQGVDNLVQLQASYIFMPFEDIYFRASAGYFEEMYGGFSGEFLYHPFDSRFAFGVDINRVWKREFRQRFGFQEYRVNTGHFNLYYNFPFYNLLGEVNIGQYLAGDRGVTYNFSRLFDTGVRVGAWATFTNVSAAQFGEGSFDKGIFVSIPFSVFLPISTTAHGNFGFRPLTRDGGQRVGVRGRLYDVSANATLNSVVHKWGKLLD